MKKNNKKKIENYKKWIDRVLVMLRNKFFVKEYEWSVGYEKDRDGIGAQIKIDTKYLNYDVTIFKCVEEMYKKGKYQQCFNILVHEMCHIYTEPLYIIAIDAVTNSSKDFLELVREQQTQRIAGCISEICPKSLWYPKKK